MECLTGFRYNPFVQRSKKEYSQIKTFIQQAKQILNFIELIDQNMNSSQYQ